MPPDYSLSEEQKQHFLEHGFIKLEGCFSPEDELCKGLMDRVWERLDMDPNNKETWNPWRGKVFAHIFYLLLSYPLYDLLIFRCQSCKCGSGEFSLI